MSDEILLRADEARDYAQDVKTASSDALQAFEALKGRLGGLSDAFRGQTATAFDNQYNEWHEAARQMLEGLDGLGDFLNQAATTIEDTDTSIAGQLNG